MTLDTAPPPAEVSVIVVPPAATVMPLPTIVMVPVSPFTTVCVAVPPVAPAGPCGPTPLDTVILISLI
ncbi:MAG: hypothetical protein FJ284_14300 [Planctomycetes bacterium]|nr:hypothetical protein [Planctomycetota bacterium]